jgi:hypothetical protein
MAKTTMNAITSIAHTNNGMRLSDMPGARILNTVATISTAIASVETSVNVISCAQKSSSRSGPSTPSSGTKRRRRDCGKTPRC